MECRSKMEWNFKIILTMILFIRIQLSNCDTCSTSASFQFHAKNSRADVAALLSDFAQFFSTCAHLCLAHKLCTSFNYHDAAEKCEILSYNHISSEGKELVSSPGWGFYQVATSEGCPEWQTMQVHKDGLGCSCRDLDNIALKKNTNQSTTCFNGTPSRAVDGNTTNIYRSGSCSHTCGGTLSWWMVDFGQTALVQSINITNRGDCCGARLANFNITVGVSTKGQGDANAPCVSNVGVPKGGTKNFKCKQTLIESSMWWIADFGQAQFQDNIALKKPTNQSSTCCYRISSKAVESHCLDGSCTHTCAESSMWWMADFGQTALVHSNTIRNR